MQLIRRYHLILTLVGLSFASAEQPQHYESAPKGCDDYQPYTAAGCPGVKQGMLMTRCTTAVPGNDGDTYYDRTSTARNEYALGPDKKLHLYARNGKCLNEQ